MCEHFSNSYIVKTQCVEASDPQREEGGGFEPKSTLQALCLEGTLEAFV